MSAHVLQAVLREAEAAAYCHRIQVWAEREQVCILDLSSISTRYNCGKSELLCDLTSSGSSNKMSCIFPQILFAALITVVIHITFDDIKLVTDIWMIACQHELPFQVHAY